MSSVGLLLQLRELLQGHSLPGARRTPVSAGQMSEEELAAEMEEQRTLNALGGFPF
jgi:hypothetical protein